MYKKDILGLYLKFKSTGGMILWNPL
jgi:hypothetical protein